MRVQRPIPYGAVPTSLKVSVVARRCLGRGQATASPGPGDRRRPAMSRADIVSGIDGSEASYAALRWATAEAGRREAPLHVVYVYEPQWPPVRPQDAEELAA